MSAVVDEWILKANGDFRVAEHEFARSDNPVYDAVCYHCQQAIEKLMKAVVIGNSQTPPFTHDLQILDGLVRQVSPTWLSDANELRFLTLAAVQYRYPGECADRKAAERAISLCKAYRSKLLMILQRSDA